MWRKHFDPHQQLKIFLVILGFTYSSLAYAYDPLDCLDDIAKSDSGIIMGLATRLCSGAWSPEPVKCYIKVSEVDSGVPRGIAIDLCAGSINSENTIKCYIKASDRGIIRGLATTLCGVKKTEK